jgi:NAD(P)-dependent dehydrogenase (short-subunit alcohol dehydrogenase family)
MAVALSKAGADVILVQRDTKNTATKDLIEKEGGKADIVVADLADKESVAKLIPHVTGELGRVLDVVVNCGTSMSFMRAHGTQYIGPGLLYEALRVIRFKEGSEPRSVSPHHHAGRARKAMANGQGGIQRRHPVENFPDDDWNEVLQVNLNTVFQITRDAGKHMLESRGGVAGQPVPEGGAAGNPRGAGKIINISSLVAFQGMSLPPHPTLVEPWSPHVARHLRERLCRIDKG